MSKSKNNKHKLGLLLAVTAAALSGCAIHQRMQSVEAERAGGV